MKSTNDILSLFEQLNNHEIFTPPRVARDMLDMLPPEVWSDPSLKFLDPCVKSGVFLREIFYRLFEGLKDKGQFKAFDGISYNLSDNRQRINHIFKNMLYGIATSELTGYVARRTLYGVMEADSDKQIAALDSYTATVLDSPMLGSLQDKYIERSTFNEYYDHSIFNTPEHEGFEKEGNIFYPAGEVSMRVAEDGNYLIEDTYFPFIDNRTSHKKILDIKKGAMKFDVIIGNPPYQLSDGGHGASAKPIYNEFIEQAIRLNPKYLSMITPSRWMVGGKGLDKFRKSFLSDKRIRLMRNFVDSRVCFPSVGLEGGVNYFLWDKSYNGACSFNGIVRVLDEFDTFIQDEVGISVLHKIKKVDSSTLMAKVSSGKPFGIRTFFKEYSDAPTPKKSIKLYGNKLTMKATNGIGYVSIDQINDKSLILQKHKVIISEAYGGLDQVLGRPMYIESNSCCSETYIVVGAFDNKQACDYLITYIKSKFFRFMVSLKKNTQHGSKSVYEFVPDLPMDREWTDAILYSRYGLTSEEINHIENRISSMD